MNCLKEPTATVDDLLCSYSSLGIPHFQRGLVWSNESVAALLESLHYDTPCGSIVLWKCNRTDYGRSLLDDDDNFEYLIVDGQQRLRSIYDSVDLVIF